MRVSKCTYLIVVPMLIALNGCGLARHLDDNPSITGILDPQLYYEPDYERFVTGWLGGNLANAAFYTAGSFSTQQIQVNPPVRMGYRRVGGKEIDDAGFVFEKWCKTNNGTPETHLRSDDKIAKELPQLLSLDPTQIWTGLYYVCQVAGSVTGAMRIELEATATDRTAILSLSHFSASSIRSRASSDDLLARQLDAVRAQTKEELAKQQAKNIAQYQAQLKTGAPVEWRAAGVEHVPFKGFVVELRPPIALIQFETLNPSPRWIKIAELEPPRQ